MILLHGSIAIPRPINGEDDFDRLFGSWSEIAPALLPTFADDHEPIRRTFDASEPSARALWTGSQVFFGRRARPAVRFSVLGSVGRSNSTLHVDMPARDARPFIDRFLQLVLAWAHGFRADLAVVHTLCAAEVAEARAIRRPDVYTINRNTGLAAMGVGFSIPTARDGLESLYWTNYLGPRLEAFFGSGTVAIAGWERMERLDGGLVAQVTIEPPDDDSWPTFRTRRDQIIDRLGRSAFFPNATMPPDLGPSVPVVT